MTIGQQARWWGIGFAALIALLWLFADILLPFVLGAALAYIADPFADRLQRLGLSRLLATVVITVLTLGLAALALVLLIPVLIDQVQTAIGNVPAVIEWIRELLARHVPALSDTESPLRVALDNLRQRLEEWSVSVLESLWSGGLALIDFVTLLVVTPVVAFYLLYDWDRMVAMIDEHLPRQHRETIRGLMRALDETLAGFVRGQLTVCAILGVFYAVALSLIGLQFGILIGAFAGLVSFIPYVGAILGGVLSVGIAVAQFWGEWAMVAAVFAVFVAGQMAEGYFLTPKLVGDRVGLHPVWLIFALMAFGSLFGFVGLLVAVPTAAGIGVFGRFALERYRHGSLYLGEDAPAQPPAERHREARGAGASQLPLRLEHRPALGRADFLVSDSNAGAVRQVTNWQAWPGRRLALVGPARSGKTHLAHVWMQEAGAERVAAACLDDRAAERLVRHGRAVVEEADGLAALEPERRDAAERALFHLANLAAAEGAWLMVTGRAAPVRWPVRMPDLASRLEALPLARLAPPDDTLLSSLMVKLFADRQLHVGSDVIKFLVRRIERSFAAVEATVEALDRRSLARQRPVTRAMAAAYLAEHAALTPDGAGEA